jgi:hypothetical protein
MRHLTLEDEMDAAENGNALARQRLAAWPQWQQRPLAEPSPERLEARRLEQGVPECPDWRSYGQRGPRYDRIMDDLLFDFWEENHGRLVVDFRAGEVRLADDYDNRMQEFFESWWNAGGYAK